ncbi:hypothetical protein BD413DRAFT_497227 [Trametes elegans]|nr:hypothetical protein BD413DRAFT_497227 [Trametes elegans]
MAQRCDGSYVHPALRGLASAIVLLGITLRVSAVHQQILVVGFQRSKLTSLTDEFGVMRCHWFIQNGKRHKCTANGS